MRVEFYLRVKGQHREKQHNRMEISRSSCCCDDRIGLLIDWLNWGSHSPSTRTPARTQCSLECPCWTCHCQLARPQTRGRRFVVAEGTDACDARSRSDSRVDRGRARWRLGGVETSSWAGATSHRVECERRIAAPIRSNCERRSIQWTRGSRRASRWRPRSHPGPARLWSDDPLDRWVSTNTTVSADLDHQNFSRILN